MIIAVAYRTDPKLEEQMSPRLVEGRGIPQKVLAQIDKSTDVVTRSSLGATYLDGLLSRYSIRENEIPPVILVYVQIRDGDLHGTKHLSPGVGAYLEHRLKSKHRSDLEGDEDKREQLIGEAADIFEQVLDAELPVLTGGVVNGGHNEYIDRSEN